MLNTTINQAADKLQSAYQSRQPCEPLRNLFESPSIELAYQIQEINTQRWLKEGRRSVGCKIGLTSESVQSQLGVDQPDFGVLFSDMHRCDSQQIDINEIMQPKIEAEVAFILEKDLTQERHTIADVISATAYALPALEVVGSRVANWDITIFDTIADNASSGLFLLGQQPKKLSEFDLQLCGMVMERNGEPASVGSGVACLGSPLNAAVWLADTMVQRGRPLLAGDIILSGALGPMVPVCSGDTFHAKVSGLGSVTAHFNQTTI